MLDQSYTSNNFKKLLRPIDFSNARHSLPSDKDKLVDVLLKVEKDFLEGKVDVTSLDEIRVKGKAAYIASDFSTDIILRKLADNIRRLYTIRQPDRTEIVKQITEILSDGTPIQVIRRDIKSFYESVDRDVVLKQINNDYLLGWESKKILKDLFGGPALKCVSGLPRGLGLSAVLSELFLRPLDRAIKNIQGVLYYARYVDDIVVVSFKNSSKIEDSIKLKLENIKLELNEKKSPPAINLPKNSKNLCECVASCRCNKSLDYLGYKISFPHPSKEWLRNNKRRYVAVSLSESKYKKIKSRVVRAFVDYTNNRDFSLLKKRLSYLTSNYPLSLNKFKKNLKGGVYYSYPLVTDESVFSELDTFLKKTIFSGKGSLGKRLNVCLTDKNRQDIKKYSFKSGFVNRYFVDLTQGDIHKISECWRYE